LYPVFGFSGLCQLIPHSLLAYRAWVRIFSYAVSFAGKGNIFFAYPFAINIFFISKQTPAPCLILLNE
jgi:hypothetical protein